MGRELLKQPGDYMYRSGNIRWDIELGIWGIMRVLKKDNKIIASLQPHSTINHVDGGDSNG